MKRVQFVLSALLVVLFLAACAPKSAPIPAPSLPAPVEASRLPSTSPAKTVATSAKPAWELEWEKTLEAASLEGKLSLATGAGGSATRIPLADAFKKAYGIPVESITAKGSETAQRVISERRAGLYNYDIGMTGGTTMINTIKPAGALDRLDPALILPEVTAPELIKKVWWGGELLWIDKDHTAIASTLRFNYSIGINTNLVKEGELKSYRDLLNPKWRGKIVMNDPTITGAGASFLSFADTVLGWDYLVELANTAEPIVIRDQRLQLDWLTHGKVAVVISPEQTSLLELMKVGAPIKGIIPAEGTWSVGAEGNVALFNRAPHPNAAKIYINWLLTKEGQKVLGVPLGAQSLRVDVPTDHLPPDQLRQPGAKFFTMEDEKVILAQPGLLRKAKDVFGPLIR